MSRKTVLVSGCFDLLHAGHIAFLKEAASYGAVHVAVGSDNNVLQLKGRKPLYTQAERIYMVQAVRYVQEAFPSAGSGVLDFGPDLMRLRPDMFIVNEDGHSRAKEELCREQGVEYLVLKRTPAEGLPARSSTDTKSRMRFPYRLCLAGGWIDQPWVSGIHSGSVVVARIRPDIDFNDRSGMASSSRNIAVELWGDRLPDGDPERNARLLFGAENPPDADYVSGSQDHLGLLLPGINRLFYTGDYWPETIESTVDPDMCAWLSSVIQLVPLVPRPEGYDPLIKRNLDPAIVRILGEAGDRCWQSILKKDVGGLGQSMTDTFRMWREMLPHTVPDWAWAEVKRYDRYPGAITSGSGGGYIMVASEEDIEDAFRVRISC
ncbi:adenylyltransferase/cytidyltransferase family protein [bacterium]|nr:adenylyltransferase/cytidyltransferase family protein [bacterium]